MTAFFSVLILQFFQVICDNIEKLSFTGNVLKYLWVIMRYACTLLSSSLVKMFFALLLQFFNNFEIISWCKEKIYYQGNFWVRCGSNNKVTHKTKCGKI